MFFHLSIHRPKPGKEKDLIASMRRFGEACMKHDASRGANVLHDEEKGTLIGLAVWDSKEEWEEAIPSIRKVVENDPFEEWEEAPPEVFHAEGGVNKKNLNKYNSRLIKISTILSIVTPILNWRI